MDKFYGKKLFLEELAFRFRIVSWSSQNNLFEAHVGVFPFLAIVPLPIPCSPLTSPHISAMGLIEKETLIKMIKSIVYCSNL
jgi:hypothetical protein